MPAPVRLVLVPGTRFTRSLWEPYRELLPGVELVPVDLPGHGSRAGRPFSSAAALAVIAEAAAGRTPGQRLVVAGHSLGGYMAMLYATRASRDATAPQAGGAAEVDMAALPDALVLLGATADPASRWAVLYRGFARVLPYVGHDRMARALNRVMRLLGVRDAYATSLPDGSAYAALPAAWTAVMAECGPHLLEEVRCPVVLANGQYDQMRVHVRRYAECCRDPLVVTIPGATHLFPVTHPRQVAEVLAAGVRLALG